MKNNLRVGIAYDAHPLVAGRRLLLGGVEVPFDKGLLGWSDGDALTHAVIDAMLGAAAMGDIGSHFPPGEAHLKDIASLAMLAQARDALAAGNWRVVNVDAIVVAVRPKLAEYIVPMRRLLSQTLGIAEGQVSIKASTANGMGFAGRGEGMAVHAVVMIEGTENESI